MPTVREVKDIFISYKNDGAGNNFGKRLSVSLKEKNYSVYFNSDEQHSGSFPNHLRFYVENCKDFILILSHDCLEQLKANREIDWVREELLIAKAHDKNIIPVLMDGVSMPSNKNDMPAALRFLPDLNAIKLPEQYTVSPIDILLNIFTARPEGGDIYRYTFNSNEKYDVTKDFLNTLSRAENGEVAAMYEIANMYYYGFADENSDSNRNFTKAYNWFKRLSDLNDTEYSPLADSMIAKMYYHGVVPREGQSYKKAFAYHNKAREHSRYSAQHYAYMLSAGLGCDFDFNKTAEYYTQIIDDGDSSAIYTLAGFYFKYGKINEAATLYEKISSSVPGAAYRLGCMYKNGITTDPPKPNYLLAEVYFQRAITLGYNMPEVYYELANLYFKPTGAFRANFKLAQDNYEKAAEKGHIGAQYILGFMYEHGHHEYNLEKAIRYYTLAADNGHLLSTKQLASLYQLPDCKNYNKAYIYAKMAADMGEKEGEFILGNLLFFGRGCQSNIDEAYEMYSRAYAHGVDQAKFMMDKIDGMNL